MGVSMPADSGGAGPALGPPKTGTTVTSNYPCMGCQAFPAAGATACAADKLAPPTIADGLRVQTPGVLTFPITSANADDVLTISDEEIISAIAFMLFRMKLLVEPSGAAAAAAVFVGRVPTDCKRVGVVLSGGNIDSDMLCRVVIKKH